MRPGRSTSAYSISVQRAPARLRLGCMSPSETCSGHRPRTVTLLRAVGQWGAGMVAPDSFMRALPRQGPPKLGVAAVLTRFVVTDLLETVPRAVQGRPPFYPTKLPIPPERHYQVQALYLPAFGVAQWLLMGGVAHALLRVTGHRSQLSRVLDVVGTGMLLPMPALWSSDLLMLATGTYRLPGLAVVHAAVQVWEATLFTIGFHAALDARWTSAAIAGGAAAIAYVPGGARFIR